MAARTVTERVGDISWAAHCVPAGSSSGSAGGDFFEVLPINATRVLIAVGDVAGHGPRVFEQMCRLRVALRAIVRDEPSPVAVVRRLNHLQSLRAPEEIATIWIGVFEGLSGLLRYFSAGHPAPVIAGAGIRPRFLTATSAPPLGTAPIRDEAGDELVLFPMGGTLVAYSDGLVERRDRDLDGQQELLRDLVTRLLGSDEITICRLLHALLTDFVPEPQGAGDDVCVLALRREAPSVAHG